MVQKMELGQEQVGVHVQPCLRTNNSTPGKDANSGGGMGPAPDWRAEAAVMMSHHSVMTSGEGPSGCPGAVRALLLSSDCRVCAAQGRARRGHGKVGACTAVLLVLACGTGLRCTEGEGCVGWCCSVSGS